MAPRSSTQLADYLIGEKSQTSNTKSHDEAQTIE